MTFREQEAFCPPPPKPHLKPLPVEDTLDPFQLETLPDLQICKMEEEMTPFHLSQADTMFEERLEEELEPSFPSGLKRSFTQLQGQAPARCYQPRLILRLERMERIPTKKRHLESIC